MRPSTLVKGLDTALMMRAVCLALSRRNPLCWHRPRTRAGLSAQHQSRRPFDPRARPGTVGRGHRAQGRGGEERCAQCHEPQPIIKASAAPETPRKGGLTMPKCRAQFGGPLRSTNAPRPRPSASWRYANANRKSSLFIPLPRAPATLEVQRDDPRLFTFCSRICGADPGVGVLGFT